MTLHRLTEQSIDYLPEGLVPGSPQPREILFGGTVTAECRPTPGRPAPGGRPADLDRDPR